MKENFILVKNNGFKWFQNKESSIFVKGYAFENGICLDGFNFITRLNELDSLDSISDFVKNANGLFVIIIRKFNTTILITDLLRTFPLFYTFNEEELIISDYAYELIPHLSHNKISEISKNEFSGFGIVTGRKTLLDNILQVQAGEILIVKNRHEIEEIFYHDFRIEKFSDLDFKQTTQKLKQAFFNAAERALKSIQNKPVVLHLSGGLDSRLVACLFKKFKISNVLCITYGRKDSSDVILSEKVAQQLGFAWKCVEYNDEVIKDYINDEEFKNYYPYAANLSSMFFMQEYFALHQLKKQNLIPENAVFFSGFGGEFLKGDYIYEMLFRNIKDVAKRILMKQYNYSLLKNSAKKQFIQQFIRQKQEGYLLNSYMENWFLKEVQSKFTQNSAQIWDFYGHEFRTILWDKEILEVLKNADYLYKNHGKLYLNILHEIYEEFGVNFPETYTTPPSLKRTQEKKDKLKYQFQFLRKLKNYRTDDIVFYKEITHAMEQEMNKAGYKYLLMKGYNSIIIQWYLFKTKEYVDLSATGLDTKQKPKSSRTLTY